MVYNFFALMLGCFCLASEMANAVEPEASDCAHNECVVFVNDNSPATKALCDGAAVTVRWNVGENVFLTTCEDVGTEEQNTNFLSDAAGNHASKLSYGRPITKNFLRLHPVGPVPDKFAPRPYCTPPSLQQATNSTFVLLDKLPANTENGYCFEPTYVYYDTGRVIIKTARATIPASDKEYFGTQVTPQQQSSLAELIHRYGPMSRSSKNEDDKSVATEKTGRRTAIISAQKAALYLAPDEAHATRAYLVRNDTVTVLKQLPGGWAYVDYVNHSGKHLLRWIKADQLAIEP